LRDLKKKESDVINSRVNFISQLIIYSLGIKRCKSEENEKKQKTKKGIRQQQQQKIVGVLEGWTRCRVDGKDTVTQHNTFTRSGKGESTIIPCSLSPFYFAMYFFFLS
jgi:hypothetical protein